MTLDEAIARYTSNSEYERTHGNLQGCMDFIQLAEWLKELKAFREQTRWIPVSERLPKECEYIGDVCKYYLVQDEYEDMHVAHFCKRGWEPIESIKALGCDVVAWMPLPEPYKAEREEE